jgi:carbon-monoxide dehydrogenase iron sulfur subunit
MARMIEVRVDRCMGCHTCELACAMAHTGVEGLDTLQDMGAYVLTRGKPGYRIHVEALGTSPVPLTCQHCVEAACVAACPTGAVHRLSNGKPVLMDKDVCIGCRMCVQACPFGMMSMEPEGTVAMKCDLCIHRQAKGEEPACVASCPTKALVFGEDEDAAKRKRKEFTKKVVAAGTAAEAAVGDLGVN